MKNETKANVETFVALVFAAPSSAQDAKLIEAAKKEDGKVVLYGSLEKPVVEAVIVAFS